MAAKEELHRAFREARENLLNIRNAKREGQDVDPAIEASARKTMAAAREALIAAGETPTFDDLPL